MSRFIDRVRGGEVRDPLGEAEDVPVWLGDLTVFDVSDAVSWWFGRREQTAAPAFARGMSLRPPYPSLWMEATLLGHSQGALVSFRPPSPVPTPHSESVEVVTLLETYPCLCFRWFEDQHSYVLTGHARSFVPLDEQGMSHQDAGGGYHSVSETYADTIGQAAAMDHVSAVLSSFLVALGLLNCRNVVAERVDPPQKVQQKRLKRGKLPLVSYHVLRLVVPSARTKRGPGAPTGQTKRIHVCRGHFAHYTEAAPLFGRYVGTYWIPAHLRGQNRVGVVLKDYLVTPGDLST